MNVRSLCLSTMFCALTVSAWGGPMTVEVVNNQPFPIHQPIRLSGIKIDGPCAQQSGNDTIVITNVRAGETTAIDLNARPAERSLVLEPVENGVKIKFKGKDWGTLAWDINLRKDQKEQKDYTSTKRNFDAIFQPLPLQFSKAANGPLFETWTAQGQKDGIHLAIQLRAYRDAFLEADVAFTNQSAPTRKVYCAVVCRWEQPAGAKRTLDYNTEFHSLNDGESSGFRAGTDRSLYVMRGVDWINTQLKSGGAAWINDFVPSFTVHKEATNKLPARWLGANTAQLGQEAQAAGAKLYSITEIARPNIRSYRSRLDDNVLPQPGDDPLTIASRLLFSDSPMSDDEVDHAFVAMTSFHHQDQIRGGSIRYTMGVPFTKFGTAYFPYSTLGENFIRERIPGMSKEGYWPLAAETVKQWKLFADDIRRDLRIIKAMGFELDRLHHLELLWDVEPQTKKPYVDDTTRQEYLDFYFSELKHLGLKALLDVKLTPQQTADLVARYGRQIEGVEIDNEIILFMIPDQEVQYWKDVYAAVKKVAPEIPVHLTGHTNTGAFNRLIKLDVPFDKVGEHAYMDSVEAIPSSRDYALAVSDYASGLNKEPVITEWNWRFLTRMPFEERAKIYPPIFENVLKTKCMPTIYQFQFQDSLAMNPAFLKGMRRYELLLLSRRPKPEALEFMKLIQKYGAPNHPNRLLDVPIAQGTVDSDGGALLHFNVTNTSGKELELKAELEGSTGVEGLLDFDEMTLKPGETVKNGAQFTLSKDAKPGFYHVFLRIEGPDGLLRYGWGILRKEGAPQFTKDSKTQSKVAYQDGALDFNLNRLTTVVYSKNCSPMELESAWTIFITLESATGRPVEIAEDDQPGANVKGRARIVVKSSKGGPAISKQSTDELLVTGGKPEDVAAAAMDFVLRYWLNAKDSAARKLGVTEAPNGKGGFRTDLE